MQWLSDLRSGSSGLLLISSVLLRIRLPSVWGIEERQITNQSHILFIVRCDFLSSSHLFPSHSNNLHPILQHFPYHTKYALSGIFFHLVFCQKLGIMDFPAWHGFTGKNGIVNGITDAGMIGTVQISQIQDICISLPRISI